MEYGIYEDSRLFKNLPHIPIYFFSEIQGHIPSLSSLRLTPGACLSKPVHQRFLGKRENKYRYKF